MTSSQPQSDHRLLITIATYNEIENLPRLVDEVHHQVPHADILVIDDNSPDGTGAWCQKRAAGDPRVRCICRPGKLGLGTATLCAMNYAIEHEYDYMLNLDADFSHAPKYIPALLAGMQEQGDPVCDVMIGSRYSPGGATEGWPWQRRLMSRCVNGYARVMLGLTPRDCSGSFRCHRVEVLKKIDFAAIRSRGYSFLEEVLWHLKRAGARMRETPITFVDRQYGESKINRREAAAALWVLSRLGVKNWIGL